MTRTPVNSSNLSSVGYNSETETLEIEFHSGGVYQYFNVPKSIHTGLMNAGSKGSYHNQYIKNSYQYRKVG